MNSRINFAKSKTTFINYIFTIIIISSIFILPADFFNENGPIETLEACTLLIGSIFCFIEYRKNRSFKSFFLTCGLLLIVFIGRELSWGRVFFHNEAGEVIKRKDWILGEYIYYILYPIFISIIIHAIKTKFIQNTYILLTKAPIMILDFLLILLMIGLSIFAEGHNLPEHLYYLNIPLEEMAEVAMYFTTALLIRTYSNNNLLDNIKDIK